MFSLCNQAIAGEPVVKYIVKEQARPILLFDARLIGPRIIEMPYPDRYQRVTIRRHSVLLGHSSKDGTDVSPNYFENRLHVWL